MIGGGTHEGAWFKHVHNYVYSFIFEKGVAYGIFIQKQGGGLHEGVAYTSEYGIYKEFMTQHLSV